MHRQEEIELQLSQLEQRRNGLERSVAAALANLAWLQDKMAAQQQLVDQGRLTRQALIETRRQRDGTEEEIRARQHQLAELQIQELAAQAQNARTLQASEYEVARARTELIQLERELKEMSEVLSTFSGRVIEVMTEQGDLVAPAQPLLRLDRTGRTVTGLEAVVYVPSAHGKRIRTGMEVRIAPSSVAPEEYGYLLGTVTYVSDFPSTSRAIQRTLRNPELVAALTQGDAPYEIRVDLHLDPATDSGYRWSSSEGPPMDILTGTLCGALITVDRRRPIDLVIPLIRDQVGM